MQADPLIDRGVYEASKLVVVLALAAHTEPDLTLGALVQGVVQSVAVAVAVDAIKLAIGTRPAGSSWLAAGVGPEDVVLERGLLILHAKRKGDPPEARSIPNAHPGATRPARRRRHRDRQSSEQH